MITDHTGSRKYSASEIQRLTPETFFEGTWQIATEKSALEFSAVAWWAGKTIHQAKGVPVGLIDNSVGGSDPLRRGWPQFRAVQAAVAAKLPHVSMIETADLGWDSPDVHPPDKRPVGERLGKAAAR